MLLCCCFRRVLAEVTVYVHKSLRSNWQLVPSHLKVQLSATPAPPKPSTTNTVGRRGLKQSAKMQQHAAKEPPQSVMTLSMSESEATPGRRCMGEETSTTEPCNCGISVVFCTVCTVGTKDT